VIPFYMIQVRHYAPAAAGAVFVPLILIMFLFSARVGALVPRVGERLLMCAGAALAGTGFAAFAWLAPCTHTPYLFCLRSACLAVG